MRRNPHPALRFASLLLCIGLGIFPGFSATPRSRGLPRHRVTLKETESLGVYDIMHLYIEDMCIKEIPFFLALHRCFHRDKRLARGAMLLLDKKTLTALHQKSVMHHGMEQLKKSSLRDLDSLFLYRKRKNRKNKSLCNFILYMKPGEYEIPKTGATVCVPGRIAGSVHYGTTTGKMVVYVHTGGIRLNLPRYAKTLTLGMVGDMDIGFAELEYTSKEYVARLLYVESAENRKRKGWSFNVTECRKIRPYTRSAK